jgi:alkyl sulfatase BDS1-like metallo-beta-lactamase superfamily hydrolase
MGVDRLRRIVGTRDGDKNGPPPPDTSVPQRRANAVVDIIYSPSKWYREVITLDASGLFRVSDERWDIRDWDVAGVAYWCPYDRFTTITDTLENARKLAAEALQLVEPAAPEQKDVEP